MDQQHRLLWLMVPPPTLRLFAATASTTSSKVNPYLIEPLGINAHLVLLLVSAPTVDFGRALDGSQLGLMTQSWMVRSSVDVVPWPVTT